MKYITTVLLFFIISKGFTQVSIGLSDSVSYDLYFYYSCNNKTEKIKDYYLHTTIEDTSYTFISDSFGICRIPTKDSLTFDIYSGLGVINANIDFTQSINIDTIIIAPIYNAPANTSFQIGPTYYSYYHCGLICNGLHKSYRQDGQLWQIGRFKRGQLKMLKTYHANGLIESKNKDRFLNTCNAKYDNSGKLIIKYRRILFFGSFTYYDIESEKYLKGRFLGK